MKSQQMGFCIRNVSELRHKKDSVIFTVLISFSNNHAEQDLDNAE